MIANILDVLLRTFTGFLKASLVTLELTIVGLVIGATLGIIFALFKVSRNRLLQKIASFYITIIRGTPLIVQISFLYFGISSFIVLSGFWAGAIALGIHTGAYVAETFRGSIQSIDKGQMEASLSLGMTSKESMRRIIFPQALKLSIPALGNQFIILLKDSSLVYVIGVAEIYSLANMEASQSFQQFESFFVAGLYYLVLVIIFSYIFKRFEKRLDFDNKMGAN
ncbi:amino acid ABC transporter permease [Peribacillus butanolivorans]|uniref:amino acid ABC transporter permease n=1 Tax=Peribacillus butanolivorans TaxID=421767 RepID=UPI00365559CE